MRHLTSTVIGFTVLAILSACGGQSGPSLRILLAADLGQLPAGASREEVMEDIAAILERRVEASGLSGKLEIESTSRLSVTLRSVSSEKARELIGRTALLEFFKPALDEFRNVVCRTADGSTYGVPFLQDLFREDLASSAMACPPDGDGVSGFVVWEPATGTDNQGVERVLTSSSLNRNAEVLGPPPSVLVEFTGEGRLLFEQITSGLIGMPIGIFLDEELIRAPTVSQPITTGKAVIIVPSEDEAERLAILVNAGALPVPIRVISIAEKP